MLAATFLARAVCLFQQAKRASHLESPEDIFDAAIEQWRELVAAVPADHFTRKDSPWLAEYCMAAVLCRLAAKEIHAGGILPGGKTSPW